MIKVVSVLIRVTVLLQPLFRRRVCKGRTRAHSLVHGAVLRRGIAGVTRSRSLIASEVIVKCFEGIENLRIFIGIGSGVAATLHISIHRNQTFATTYGTALAQRRTSDPTAVGCTGLLRRHRRNGVLHPL